MSTARRTTRAIVASGPVDSDASGFTIVITGGTDTYIGDIGARGEVTVAAVKNTVGAAKKKGA
jgi:formylmethanofuran dehydrogenase subunit C